MQTFTIDSRREIACNSKKTHTAFKHEAIFLVDGQEVDRCKICYQNRTWERYEYESVLSKMLNRIESLTPEQRKIVLDRGRIDDPAMKKLNQVGAVAALGDIFHAGDKKVSNDWKAQMLKAGIGDALDMPEDWPTLTEDEKARRLNGAIGQLSTKV